MHNTIFTMRWKPPLLPLFQTTRADLRSHFPAPDGTLSTAMTKKAGNRWLFFGIAVIVLSFPWLLSWVDTTGFVTKPSAHYLGGLSRIMGAFGAHETAARFSVHAELIHLDRVHLKIHIDDEDELEAVRRFGLYSWAHSYSADLTTGQIAFEIDKDQKDRCQADLLEFLTAYRSKRQANPDSGVQAEENGDSPPVAVPSDIR